MEALAAVGLATNIITFLDFAATLVKGAKEMSSSGSLSDLDQIRSRTTHLRRLVQPLQVHPGLPVSSGGRELDGLARDCVALAAETTTVLDKIHAHVQGPPFLTNARVAFRALRKKGQLESLQKRLDSYQSLILTQVALLIREDQMSIFTLATDIGKRNDETAARVGGQLDSLRGDLISAVDSGRADTASGQANIACLLEDLKSKLEHLIQVDKDDRLIKTILDKLWFDGMLDRESAVHDPVGNSYGWLLDPQTDQQSWNPYLGQWHWSSGLKWQPGHEETRISFSHWLTAEAGLFYISGKPGSGKSTLMKFLVQNTRSRLEVWAAAHSRKLLVVSFFFWISGTPIQRSVEGLYRAVLWEILKASPQLIPEVFPSRWKDPDNKDVRIHHLPLSDSEIRHALERLKKALNTSHALCLFIDGLDEYDGDHWKLGHELASWKSDHVKICVSARPYNAFDLTLPLDTSRHFRLQDLNQRDIMHCVRTTLSGDQRFGELQTQDDYATERTISKLTARSDGVFLWAVLATKTLLLGLGNRYTSTQMLGFLDSEIPSGLEALFLQMLDRLPKTDRKLAAISLLVLAEPQRDKPGPELFSQHLNLILHWYIEEAFRKSGHCNQHLDALPRLDLQQSTSDQILAAKSRFNSRCAGFIEWKRHEDAEWYRFEIIHRTLGDFLRQPDTRSRLRGLAETVDVPMVISSAYLNILHDFSGPQTTLPEGWPFFWDVFMLLVYMAELWGEDEPERFDKMVLSALDLPKTSPGIRARTDLKFSRRLSVNSPHTARYGFFPRFDQRRYNVASNNTIQPLWQMIIARSWNLLIRTRRQLFQLIPETSRSAILLTTAVCALSYEKDDFQKAIRFARFFLEKGVGPNSTVSGCRQPYRVKYCGYTIGADPKNLTRPETIAPFAPTSTVWELFLQAAWTWLNERIGEEPDLQSLRNASKLIELLLTFGANPDSWFIGINGSGIPAKLHRVTLRQLIATINLPISDTIFQYLRTPEVILPHSLPLLCPALEESIDFVTGLPRDQRHWSSFVSLGVASGQWISNIDNDILFVCQSKRGIVVVDSEQKGKLPAIPIKRRGMVGVWVLRLSQDGSLHHVC